MATRLVIKVTSFMNVERYIDCRHKKQGGNLNTCKRILLVLLIIAAAAGIIACTDSKDTAKLEDVRWVLQSYGTSGNMTVAVADKESWIELKSADKTVSGNAGVNGFGGKYKIDGNKITWDSLMQTLMAGPEPLMKQEAEFMKILAPTSSFKIEGKKLTITSKEGTLVFTQK
jgi:heat shock protein HslJ